MKLKRPDGELMTAEQLAASETIPKLCFVAPPPPSPSGEDGRGYSRPLVSCTPIA
jgi:hypothetical protein